MVRPIVEFAVILCTIMLTAAVLQLPAIVVAIVGIVVFAIEAWAVLRRASGVEPFQKQERIDARPAD